MVKNDLGEDSPRDGIESLTTLEEDEFKLPIDGCINVAIKYEICPLIG